MTATAIPARAYNFANELSCVPHAPRAAAIQDHVVKHVLGMKQLLAVATGGRRVWNAEGWDRTHPPVISAAEREALTAAIKALDVSGHRCAVPRLQNTSYGGPPASQIFRYCYDCPLALLDRCAALTAPASVRYLAVIEPLLDLLDASHGIRVSRASVLYKGARLVRSDPARLEGMALLSLGWTTGGEPKRIGRVSGWNGIRVEFYATRTRLQAWRSTYRNACASEGLVRRLDFVLESPAGRDGEPPGLWSNQCIVPRDWWEGVRHVT